MKTLKIRSPIFSSMSIGIASFRVSGDLKIQILYKRKDGSRMFPNDYFMKKEKIITYPIKILNNNIRLYIIPIADLTIINEN